MIRTGPIRRTELTTRGRTLRLSTTQLGGAFFQGKTVYETAVHGDGGTCEFDWTRWSGSREDAVAAHRETLDDLRLSLALFFGETVIQERHWPLELERTENA